VNGYNVYRATTRHGEGSKPYAVGVTTASFTDPGVVSGLTYFYQVSAVNGGGESGKTSEVSQTLAPAAPTALLAHGGATQVTLSWVASTGATSYNIYRGSTA